MPTLTGLPTELLHLTAEGLSAPDILALSRTCRRLNKAYDSAAVFQMSFELQLPEHTSAAFEDKAALVRFMNKYVAGPNKPCQRNEDPKMAWLCLAVAISRLPTVSTELERLVSSIKTSAVKSQMLGEDTITSFQGLLGFLATLPIWGYTHACNLRIAALFADLFPLFFYPPKHLNHDQCVSGDHRLQFAFCLAMGSLETRQLDMSKVEPLRTFIKDSYEATSWIGKQTSVLLVVTFIARTTRYLAEGEVPVNPASLSRLRFLEIHNFPGRHRNAIDTQLPNPENIELLGPWYFAGDKAKTAGYESWTGTTILRPRFPVLAPNLVAFGTGKGRYFSPFAGDEWWSWYTTRVRDLVRRLDQGEWYGTVAHNVYYGSYISPPMEQIRFRKTGGDGDKYSVEANGVDRNGTFTLRGEVDASDAACTVRLRWQFRCEVADWDGLVTPFGICGIDRTSEPIGFFWLWKREWMDDVV
ncbi:hypothetical protein GGR54DRAFT_600447 [Hypoxylon sp. NC1633]|nr:hypothetical protein GGR54DRAFT_600447 [Hypoxylon sp. NC1633]